MNDKLERFNEFLMSAVSPNDWESELKPAVYARKEHDNDGWVKMFEEGNPYLAIPIFVACGLDEQFESMLVMYGNMAKVDTESDSEERKRVRILIYMNGDEPVLGVQPQGEVVFEPDDAGEGAMPDALAEMIRAHKEKDTDAILAYIATQLAESLDD